ncbi:MAG: NnrS family protein [Limisphaerales bacterium]
MSAQQPSRCPRHLRPREADQAPRDALSFADLHREPFRLFFPAATLAGLVGVSLWPLVLLGWMTDYPGVTHARLMVQGFFGGFMFGFLGTSMPRLLEVPTLSVKEAFPLLALFVANVVAHLSGATGVGDALFAVELVLWFALLKNRCHAKRDLPPPTFVLVGLSFACGLAGTALFLAGRRWELTPELELLARLMSYHAFVLLCVLGAGGFLLPRFLGLGVRRKFPTTPAPTPEWRQAARFAGVVGFLMAGSFVLEAFGWSRAAVSLRAALIAGYLWHELPLERLRWTWNGVQWLLVVGLACLPLGVLLSGWLPAWRVSMSHVELLGGFGLITMGVATRVVFGHSGEREQLERFHGPLTVAAGLMLIGLLSRLSGDFLPGSMLSHYLYGALCWAGGLLLWAVRVLPKVLRPDPEP